MPARRFPRIGLLTAWASRANGGVFEAVVAHAALLRDNGYEPVVLALADEHGAADRGRFAGGEVVTCPVRGPRAVGYAPGLVPALKRAELDLLHLHGIWMYPSRAAGDWAGATGRPYVISPHGMLDPWILGRGRAKKAIARILYERRSWRRAAAFHALTGREAADIARATGRRGASFVVPNAIPLAAHRADDGPPFVLYLGRIHPKKNIDALIDGWDEAADALRPAGARLVIAGWGDAEHVAALEARIAGRAGTDVAFVGPVYGEEKADLLARARFLALASHSEGLPVAILEGWAAGTPTLMSEHCNLPQGFAAGAAIDCGTTPATIAAALRRGMALAPAGWQKMSDAGSALAAGAFSPAAVGAAWRDHYAALLGAGARAA